MGLLAERDAAPQLSDFKAVVLGNIHIAGDGLFIRDDLIAQPPSLVVFRVGAQHALRAVDLQPIQLLVLLGRQGHAAGEDSAGAVGVVQYPCCEPIHTLIGEIRDGAYAFGLAQQPHGLADAVATQVVQAAAQCFLAHADVGEIVIGGDEGIFQVAYLSDGSFVQLHLDRGDQRAVQIGKGLHEDYAVLLCGCLHFRSLPRRGSERLFTQDMLACLRSLDHPFIVQRIGQGNVDRFNDRVCQKRFIAAIGLFKAKFPPELLRLLRTASGDGVQLAILRQLHAGDGTAPGDIGRAQYAPFDFSHLITSCFAPWFCITALSLP